MLHRVKDEKILKFSLESEKFNVESVGCSCYCSGDSGTLCVRRHANIMNKTAILICNESFDPQIFHHYIKIIPRRKGQVSSHGYGWI